MYAWTPRLVAVDFIVLIYFLFFRLVEKEVHLDHWSDVAGSLIDLSLVLV